MYIKTLFFAVLAAFSLASASIRAAIPATSPYSTDPQANMSKMLPRTAFRA